MHVNNKAEWQREFSVAVSVLCIKAGLSERTVNNARNDLKIKGFIDFRSRKGNQAAIYSLVDLSATIADNASYNDSDKPSDNLSGNVSALIKLNETKQNEIINKDDDAPAKENPFRFYEENGFGVIGSYISEKISSWCEDLSDELVILAMKRSTEQGKKTWGYVEAILKDWFDKGLKTTGDVEAYQFEFKEKQTQKQNKVTPYRRGSARIEVVPEWMQNKPAEESNEPVNIKDLEDRKRKMEQMFQQINS
ncbi:DnaD domain protein [Peribacillus loiseleuriae]|uniref:DnaD domain-containing protein n=1 Tax=Peribacillus loiseleuriae TaxID=1679170 RepID=UPI0038199FF2